MVVKCSDVRRIFKKSLELSSFEIEFRQFCNLYNVAVLYDESCDRRAYNVRGQSEQENSDDVQNEDDSDQQAMTQQGLGIDKKCENHALVNDFYEKMLRTVNSKNRPQFVKRLANCISKVICSSEGKHPPSEINPCRYEFSRHPEDHSMFQHLLKESVLQPAGCANYKKAMESLGKLI